MMKTLIPGDVFERIRSLRRDLHRYPEPSGEEALTAEKVSSFLESLGLVPKTGVAGHGVVADVPGSSSSSPVIALRADMDALPIHEETGLPFASQRKGLMHACGHDGHTAMLAGAACLLMKKRPRCGVRLIFQPAEETAQGARAMVEAGVLDGVSMIFGGHLDRHYPLGAIVVTDGPVNASSDLLRIAISGRGGHAGRPHETTDAVVAASLLVVSLQTIVSREVNPDHPSVVSIGRVQAGEASNVIAETAQLEGSIRAQEESVRRYLHEAVRRIGGAIGQLHGASIETVIEEKASAVVNDPGAVQLARKAAAGTVGSDMVLQMDTANMGAEDFSFYTQKIPGCYVRFGITTADREYFPAHSSRFDFNEQALAVGARYYAETAWRACRKLAEKAGAA